LGAGPPTRPSAPGNSPGNAAQTSWIGLSVDLLDLHVHFILVFCMFCVLSQGGLERFGGRVKKNFPAHYRSPWPPYTGDLIFTLHQRDASNKLLHCIPVLEFQSVPGGQTPLDSGKNGAEVGLVWVPLFIFGGCGALWLCFFWHRVSTSLLTYFWS